MLEREISFLEEELKSVSSLQPASQSCKEVTEFVLANPDPLLPTTQKKRKSCRFWKWLSGWSCFSFSWICCCSICPLHIEPPCCCPCDHCSYSRPCRCKSCFRCSVPNPHCPSCSCSFSCPRSNCCCKNINNCCRDTMNCLRSCLCCCGCFRIPSCPTITDCCSCWPKCPKVKCGCFSCKETCCSCSCNNCNPCFLCY